MRAIVLGIVLMLGLLVPAVVEAQPLGQRCAANATAQYDMAGTYMSYTSRMYVELYPCGGAYVTWENEYGSHAAAYGTVQRVPGEGVIARRLPESYESLDATEVIGFKAAEPGYIQVFTTDRFGAVVGVYHLQKMP